MQNFFYKVNDKEYEVVIVPKKIKNIHYRFREGKFFVSCRSTTLKSQVVRGLDRFAETLIKRSAKEEPIGEDYIYLFGEKYIINQSGKMRFEGYPEINYKNHEDLLKKLRPIFLSILTSRVRYYERQMGLPSYSVSIRKMTSRYGSNSRRTKNLNFAFLLIHYSYSIIDSVIVHELAHIEVFNHSKEFYDVVYKYCPDYKKHRNKLRKGEYK